MSSKINLVQAGTVSGHHGVKGEVKISAGVSGNGLSEFLKTITAVAALYIDGTRYEVIGLRGHKGVLLARLKGIGSREDAESLIGKAVCVDKGDLPELLQGEFYMHELLGSEVVTEDGRELGRLVNVFSTGSNDVFEIKGKDREVLLPVIEGVTRKVDVSKRLIVVSVPEGLLDEDSADGVSKASKPGSVVKERKPRGSAR